MNYKFTNFHGHNFSLRVGQTKVRVRASTELQTFGLGGGGLKNQPTWRMEHLAFDFDYDFMGNTPNKFPHAARI